MNALTEEAVLPTLHNLILAEVYLSGGPVDVFRLWSEMYERQKTIDVGTLLFVRAIAHLEQQGFLQKVSESKSAITGKGEAYLVALLLAGSLSDEALGRLAESGLKLASTGNILDVADRATGNAPVTDGLQVGDEGGGEILSSSPLYLLASEIVDIVEFSEQLRLEEEDAAEEGAAIEASNMPYPEYERNGR